MTASASPGRAPMPTTLKVCIQNWGSLANRGDVNIYPKDCGILATCDGGQIITDDNSPPKPQLLASEPVGIHSAPTPGRYTRGRPCRQRSGVCSYS
jgi:hypothetical protein